jgi:hypothetical protein
VSLQEWIWNAVPFEVERMVKVAAPVLADWMASHPDQKGLDYVWFQPDTQVLREDRAAPAGYGVEPWMPIKVAAGAFRPVFDAAQLTPNKLNALVGGPTPLASSLAGGLLGAGLGYGGGWLAEKLLGSRVLEPGRLRKNLALAGGAVGTLPGLYLGSVGARLNAEDGKSPLKALIEPNRLFGKQSGVAEMLIELNLPDDPVFKKSAEDFVDQAGGLYMPSIPVDAFNRTIWMDPNTPIPLRAAATGLIESASQLQGGARMISPFDVGKIAVGMGSGLVSGMLVGKALGALAGLTPAGQDTLRRTGMWAGALANVIPKAFGY